MKKLSCILIGFLVAGSVFAQRGIYTDSIKVDTVVAADTVLWIPLHKVSAGGGFALEMDYTGLDSSGVVVKVGCSMFGNTFNALQGWGSTAADSVVLSLADSVSVNGVYSGKSAHATQPVSQAWMKEYFPFTYLNILLKPNSVGGWLIYRLRQL